MHKVSFSIKEDSLIARVAAAKLRAERAAIVLGNTVHLWRTTSDDFLNNERWVRHELTHIRQFKQYGFLKFILLYLFESIRNGYYNNKYEVEARRMESGDDNLITR